MKRWLVRIAIVLVVLGGVAFAIPQIVAFAEFRLNAVIRQALRAHSKSIEEQMDRIASEQTATFVLENMPKVPALPNRFAMLDYSLKAVNSKLIGLYCEFGVYTGSTINFIASQTDRTIHGFDSFEGLPEDWRTGAYKGTFGMDGLPKVRKNVKLYKGWFDQTLPVWAKENPGPIIFMHLDADLYSSTKTVFDVLGDRVIPGTVIQFDEYFNYPGWQYGEQSAFAEFVERRGIEFEYVGYCNVDEQVSVRIRRVGSPDRK